MELENRQICRDVTPRCILMSAWELASAFAICFSEIEAFLESHAETKMILMLNSEFATCLGEEMFMRVYGWGTWTKETASDT